MYKECYYSPDLGGRYTLSLDFINNSNTSLKEQTGRYVQLLYHICSAMYINVHHSSDQKRKKIFFFNTMMQSLDMTGHLPLELAVIVCLHNVR